MFWWLRNFACCGHCRGGYALAGPDASAEEPLCTIFDEVIQLEGSTQRQISRKPSSQSVSAFSSQRGDDERAAQSDKELMPTPEHFDTTTTTAASGSEYDFDSEWRTRGVRVDDELDFYNVARKKLQIRKTAECIDATYCLPSSASDCSSSSTSCAFESGSSTPKQVTPRGKKERSELEIVTNWGVLVGVMMHSRMVGMADVAVLLLEGHRKQTHAKGYRLMHSVQRRAQAVLDEVRQLALRVGQEEKDCLDGDWEQEGLLTKLFTSEYADTLLILSNTARKVFAMQPMLARAEAPCRIFGDLHGQLRDLLLLFNTFGCPEEKSGPSYVFNGDFVDRGAHQLEVIGILFALKVLMPDRIWLVRGNHEDRLMNEKYGFRNECNKRIGKDFGLKAYEHIHKAFDQLPVACVISDRVLVVHGGLGDGRWTLDDVEGFSRPLSGDRLYDSFVFNMLWSDPMDDDDREGSSKASTFGIHASPRKQNVVQFGWNVTKMFCARNGLGLIVRSHECKQGGMGFDVMHEKRLVRVFSARDYEENGNGAAVLNIIPTDSVFDDDIGSRSSSKDCSPRQSSKKNYGRTSSKESRRSFDRPFDRRRSESGRSSARLPPPLLTVRPQVLHSTSQAIEEARARRMERRNSASQVERRRKGSLTALTPLDGGDSPDSKSPMVKSPSRERDEDISPRRRRVSLQNPVGM